MPEDFAYAPVWCPNCDELRSTDLVARMEKYELRGEAIVVPAVVRVCQYCGSSVNDFLLDSHTLRRVYEEYNRRHPDHPIALKEPLEPEPPLVQDMRRALRERGSEN